MQARNEALRLFRPLELQHVTEFEDEMHDWTMKVISDDLEGDDSDSDIESDYEIEICEYDQLFDLRVYLCNTM